MEKDQLSSSKRLINSKSGLRIVALDNSLISPFELSEPPWTPDKESPECVECHTKFDLIKRRHHCRRCGQVYCNTCCHKKMFLPRMCFLDPVRVCNACTTITVRENEFFEKHLSVLFKGANFVENKSGTLNTFLCRLSTNHKNLVFEGTDQEPIFLSSIFAIKTIASPNVIEGGDAAGGADIHGVRLLYRNASAEPEESSLTLTLPPYPAHKPSVSWVLALQKALKLIQANQPSPDN